jgi:hypothetical protein
MLRSISQTMVPLVWAVGIIGKLSMKWFHNVQDTCKSYWTLSNFVIENSMKFLREIGVWFWYCWKLLNEPLGVMAQRYSPYLRPWNLKKVFWVQTHCCVGESLVGPMPMSFTCGCQWLVGLGLLLCFQKKKKKISMSKILYWLLCNF